MSNLETDKNKKGNRLGRGLEGLFSSSSIFEEEGVTTDSSVKTTSEGGVETPTSIADEKRVWSVAVEKLVPNKNQPRKYFEVGPLKELANSISEKGVIQPILAKKLNDGRFEIIAGERRWRASQQAGLKEVPVVLRKSNDKDTLEVALIENIQRQNLNPIEEAEAYQFLMDSHSMTQQQVAEKVGKERTTVTNSLRLLGLMPEVREMVVSSLLSSGHARALLSMSDKADQLKTAKKIIANKLSVRATEALVAKNKKTLGKLDQDLEIDMGYKMAKSLGADLQKLMGTKVKIDYKNGKGKLSVLFYSDGELSEIVETMRNGCQH